MELVFLALGSNMGDREEHLRAGIHGLSLCGIDIVQSASVYSTEPLEVVDQPWFLNTVIQVRTDHDPHELLRICLEVEKENHRVRDTNKGPRTLDIDILFYGSAMIRKHGLSIPHPSFASRRFVLAPLAEIAADFVDPLSGKTVRELLAACRDMSSVVRYRASSF